MPSPAHIRTAVASIVDQPEDLRELRNFHKALADVNRLRMVQRMAAGAATVGELIEFTGLSQPLVSWHLTKLKAAGIVETKRSGREVYCQLRSGIFGDIARREEHLLGLAAIGGLGGASTTSLDDIPAPAPANLRAEAH